MKNYTITVNGTAYDVTVEEKKEEVQAVHSPMPLVSEVVPKDVKTSISNVSKGIVCVEAGAAGKIFKIEVNIGQRVKKGSTIAILEAMKMEIPVVAVSDGVVASIDVTVGETIEAGHVLATLN